MDLKNEIIQRHFVIDENTMVGIVKDNVTELLKFCKDIISKEGPNNNIHQKM